MIKDHHLEDSKHGLKLCRILNATTQKDCQHLENQKLFKLFNHY